MSGQAAAAEEPAGRDRTHVPGWLRAGGAIGCAALVVGFVAWEFWPRSHPVRDTQVTKAAFSMGRPLSGSSTAAPAREVPAPPGHATATSAAAPEAAVPPPSASVPAVKPMSFWEDSGGASTGQAASGEQSRRGIRNGEGLDAAGRLPPAGAAPSEYAQRMKTTSIADARPPLHRYPPQFTIRKSTKFSCLPDQPISSELPGPVSCQIQDDVMSMDGTNALLPRGTTVNGTIEHGLSFGDNRLFLVWTDALTPAPDWLPIPLDSPAADELGQIGVPGDLRDHLWRKLKATLAITLIETASRAGVAAAQSGNNNTYLNGLGGGGGGSLIEQAFAHDLNIPTTLYRGQSQPVTVYVNHYIDLSAQYRDKVIRR